MIAATNIALDTVSRIRNSISDPNDGPVTRFVLIARACRMMEDAPSQLDAEDVANALYEELVARRLMPADPDPTSVPVVNSADGF